MITENNIQAFITRNGEKEQVFPEESIPEYLFDMQPCLNAEDFEKKYDLQPENSTA